jgi:DNA-binding NarL/FixJ family response regulator
MDVLVADERAWVRGALRLFLEELFTRARVGEVSDAEALYRFTAAEHPDLILLDAALPRHPGVAPLRHCVSTLRALHPPVYIIVLYGNREKHDAVCATGADAWVSKAEAPDRLLAALPQAAG